LRRCWTDQGPLNTGSRTQKEYKNYAEVAEENFFGFSFCDLCETFATSAFGSRSLMND